MDSITKAPDGLMLGRLHFPGHFDECVKARNDEFKGQHCMLEMSLDSQDGKDSAQVNIFIHITQP